MSFFFKSFMLGARILRENKEIGIIHSSTFTSAIPASVLGSVFGKKRILTVHEIFGKLRKQFKPRGTRRIYQLFEWLCFVFKYDEYHCVSLYTLNSIRLRFGIPDKKLHLIYNGVDEEFWDYTQVDEIVVQKWKDTYQRNDKYLMLYYGHSGMSKGIDFLVEAIPEIIKKHPDGILIFNLIDAKRDSTIKQRILQQAKKGGSPKQVIIFDGREREQLRDLVACVDVVIAPSLAEGFGSVHSEVSAMKIPLITTQVAAIPEVVSGKIKFIQASSSKAIVKGIEKVRKGKFNLIESKRFNWDNNVDKLEQLYDIISR